MCTEEKRFSRICTVSHRNHHREDHKIECIKAFISFALQYCCCISFTLTLRFVWISKRNSYLTNKIRGAAKKGLNHACRDMRELFPTKLFTLWEKKTKWKKKTESKLSKAKKKNYALECLASQNLLKLSQHFNCISILNDCEPFRW